MTVRRFPLLLAFASTLALGGCDLLPHDDHAEAEAPGEAGVVFTHFTPGSELFVEFPPLAVGRESPFAVHLTDLRTFRPVADGTTVVRLIGPAGEERFEARSSATPGIFRPTAQPRTAGPRRLLVELRRGSTSDVHDLGTVTVHANEAAAVRANPEQADPPGRVAFLKEQHWRVDFAAAPVEAQRVRASVPARLVVQPAASGEAAVSAPTSGRVDAVGAFPFVGQNVRAGQGLFRLRPIGGEASTTAGLVADRARASAELTAARSDLARAERLLAQGAVSRRRVEEARARVTSLQGAVAAAQGGLAATGGPGGAMLSSPISGQIVELAVRRGGAVASGETLARIVNPSRVRIEARVAESDLPRLTGIAGVAFAFPGQPVTETVGARLIGVAAAVDPETRTVPVVFEANGGPRLPIGLSAPGQVLLGMSETAPAVPREAIVDDAGQSVVYVMADGEHFERRVVRTGGSEGGWVQVLDGLRLGERVVTRGAYLVRLAEAGPAATGEGHAH